MGKNRNFRNEYTIVVAGSTTNGAKSENVDEVLRAMIKAIDMTYAVRIDITPVKTLGDFNAITGELTV